FEGGSGEEMWAALAEANGYESLDAMWEDPEFDMSTILSALPELSADSGVVAEDPATVAERAIAGLKDVATEHAPGGGDVLVVSSGLTIYFVLEALGADLSEVTEGIGNGTVSKLSYADGEWTVESVNDSSFVEGAAE
ncbi:MAG: histidine phosphatase family protein, partial [Microterricola sp.]